MQVQLELANEWQVLDEGYDLVWPEQGQEFEIPRELELTVNVLQPNPSEYETEKKAHRRHVKNGIFSERAKMYNALRDVIAQRQAQYVTTIAEDKELLNDANLTKRHRLALEVRLGEKQLLAAALGAVNKAITAGFDESNEQTQTVAIKRRKI